MDFVQRFVPLDLGHAQLVKDDPQWLEEHAGFRGPLCAMIAVCSAGRAANGSSWHPPEDGDTEDLASCVPLAGSH